MSQILCNAVYSCKYSLLNLRIFRFQLSALQTWICTFTIHSDRGTMQCPLLNGCKGARCSGKLVWIDQQFSLIHHFVSFSFTETLSITHLQVISKLSLTLFETFLRSVRRDIAFDWRISEEVTEETYLWLWTTPTRIFHIVTKHSCSCPQVCPLLLL